MESRLFKKRKPWIVKIVYLSIMIRIVICFLFVSQFSFSNTSSEFTGFNEISFEEYKLQKMAEIEINNIFVKTEKRNELCFTLE